MLKHSSLPLGSDTVESTKLYTTRTPITVGEDNRFPLTHRAYGDFVFNEVRVVEEIVNTIDVEVDGIMTQKDVTSYKILARVLGYVSADGLYGEPVCDIVGAKVIVSYAIRG
jgi:hypothetical protein